MVRKSYENHRGNTAISTQLRHLPPMHGYDSKTAQYLRVMVELGSPQVKLIRFDFPKTFYDREDNSFLRGMSVLIISIDY